MGPLLNMKLALVFLIASQALAAPSSSEEDMDMRAFSSSEEGMDMRTALSSSEEDMDMRAFSSAEEDMDMRDFSSEEDMDMRSFSSEEDMDMRAATCKCGIKGGANRIVGGVEARPNEFPWIASLILI